MARGVPVSRRGGAGIVEWRRRIACRRRDRESVSGALDRPRRARRGADGGEPEPAPRSGLERLVEAQHGLATVDRHGQPDRAGMNALHVRRAAAVLLDPQGAHRRPGQPSRLAESQRRAAGRGLRSGRCRAARKRRCGEQEGGGAGCEDFHDPVFGYAVRTTAGRAAGFRPQRRPSAVQPGDLRRSRRARALAAR